MITRGQYDKWIAAWMAQHPRQLPPSYEQTRDLQDMFLLPDSYFEVPRYGIDESDESEDD